MLNYVYGDGEGLLSLWGWPLGIWPVSNEYMDNTDFTWCILGEEEGNKC